MKRIFVDAQCLIAAAITKDTHHQRAIRLITEFEQQGAKFISTNAVLIEFCNALSKNNLRARAWNTVDEIVQHPDFEIVHVTQALFDKAYGFYKARPDKDWGLTDCISFVVMREQKISQALTADVHFAQAGFEALLQ